MEFVRSSLRGMLLLCKCKRDTDEQNVTEFSEHAASVILVVVHHVCCTSKQASTLYCGIASHCRQRNVLESSVMPIRSSKLIVNTQALCCRLECAFRHQLVRVFIASVSGDYDLWC
jgi:hypothetical protein